MKRILICVFILVNILSGSCFAFSNAEQSAATRNVLIEGKIENMDSFSGQPITILLKEGNAVKYIGEIEVEPSGKYSKKFYYNGDASQLSYDLMLDGNKINDTVIRAVVGKSELVSAKVFTVDQDGAGVIFGEAARTPYTAGRFTYNPSITIPKDTEVGVVIYPDNRLGGDGTAYTVLLAQYNDEKTMIACDVLKSDELSFYDIGGQSAVDCGKVQLDSQTASVNAFLWDGVNSMIPYKTELSSEKPSLYIVGDSTYQNWGAAWFPQAGIGSFLGDYFNPNLITVLNKGVSGSSAQSWLDNDPALGNWNALLPLIKEGDYVVIGLGINDLIGSQSPQKLEGYRSGLAKMIKDVFSKGAEPLLVSPILHSYDNASGNVEIPSYIKEANKIEKALAEEYGIAYLPIEDIAYEECKDNTAEQQRKEYHLDYEAVSTEWGLTETELAAHGNGSIKNGKSDALHINVKGADYFASKIKQALLSSNSTLKHYLK